MTLPEPATRHVIVRCPSCGVEHDAPAPAGCEACHTPLRAWCCAHSREIGWLDGHWCSHCEEEDAHRTGRPRRPAPPPPPPPSPAPVARVDAPVDADEAVPDGHAAPLTAPLDGAVPDASEVPRRGVADVFAKRVREAAEKPPKVSPAPPTTPPPADVLPVPAPAPPAEPVEERRAHVPRPRLLMRLIDGLLTVLQTGIVGVLFGVVIGGIRAYRLGAEVPLEAATGGALGGMAGLALGVLIAIVLFLRPARQRGDG
jgi:hypothetical protein